MTNEMQPIFIGAGEPSGDVLGGRLMGALTELCPGGVRFVGVGGEAMQAQGLESLFPMEELTVMVWRKSCRICRACCGASDRRRPRWTRSAHGR